MIFPKGTRVKINETSSPGLVGLLGVIEDIDKDYERFNRVVRLEKPFHNIEVGWFCIEELEEVKE